jgi:hypothetical protein
MPHSSSCHFSARTNEAPGRLSLSLNTVAKSQIRVRRLVCGLVELRKLFTSQGLSLLTCECNSVYGEVHKKCDPDFLKCARGVSNGICLLSWAEL